MPKEAVPFSIIKKRAVPNGNKLPKKAVPFGTKQKKEELIFMLCQNCNEREANVKYTQIINGVKKQMNLCDKCAKELGIDDISFNMPIHFSNFLGDIFEDGELLPAFIKPEILSCDKCGLSYDDFIKNGKFGCEKCYETFHSKMDSLLKNIHRCKSPYR